MANADQALVVIECPHCGTRYQLPYEAIGTKGSLEIVIPYNAPPDTQTAVLAGVTFDRNLYRREIMPPVDQYTLEAENFALAVLGEQKLSHGVDDAIQQMRILDAIFRSEKSGAWETI